MFAWALQRKYLVCYDRNRVSWLGERVDVDLIIVLREVGAKVSKPQPQMRPAEEATSRSLTSPD